MQNKRCNDRYTQQKLTENYSEFREAAHADDCAIIKTFESFIRGARTNAGFVIKNSERILTSKNLQSAVNLIINFHSRDLK